jgi:proline- and glutamine-rich splicing factor
MLYNTFSIFGEVERAIHIVDEKGKPTGEGIVEFERKGSAQDALRSIEDRVFMVKY